MNNSRWLIVTTEPESTDKTETLVDKSAVNSPSDAKDLQTSVTDKDTEQASKAESSQKMDVELESGTLPADSMEVDPSNSDQNSESLSLTLEDAPAEEAEAAKSDDANASDVQMDG